MNQQIKEAGTGKIHPGRPRYRYWMTPPESVTVRVADLEQAIPAPFRVATFPADRTVDLPAGEIFSTNVPAISLGRLCELLPDLLSQGEDNPLIRLPADRLALAYALSEHSEELPPEPEPELPQQEPPPEPSPAQDLSVEKQDAPADDESSGVVTNEETSPGDGEPAAPEQPPVAGASEPTAAPPEPAGPLEAEEKAPAVAPAAKSSGLFSGLPIFRRMVVPKPPQEKKDPAPSPGIPEISLLAPIPELQRPESAADPEQIEAAKPEPDAVKPSEPEPVVENPSPAGGITVPEIRTLEVETVSSSPRAEEIPGQEQIQSLFLTEETLTVKKVMELCCGLPGISSCVLTRGTSVVSSFNTPGHVDLVSISANAAGMLQAMREASAKMGVGAVPAVTLHTEKGVMSFFQRDDLSMLVFHKDRGFVPGVREKFLGVLDVLASARLALPAGEPRS